MRQHRPAPSATERISNAYLAVGWGFTALQTSLALARRGLGSSSGLASDAMLALLVTLTLALGGVWAWVRVKGPFRRSTALAVTQTERQQKDHRLLAAFATAMYGFVCIDKISSAWELLQNSALGWGYKACFLVALNGTAYALLQSVPLVLSAFEDSYGTRDAQTSTVTAPVVAQASLAPTTTADAEPAPLVAGRNR